MTEPLEIKETLTPEDLLLALDALRGKWSRPGAAFTGEVTVQPGRVTQGFTFDDQGYEVTVFADQSLLVTEVDGARRLPVMVPRGMALPKGFKRTQAYHRAQ